MAKLEDFTNEELLKVLLEAKSISKGLSDDEQEVYDALPTLDRSRRRETVIILSNNGFLTVELQRIKQTVSGAKIWRTFPSTEKINGITVDGLRKIYELRDVISNR